MAIRQERVQKLLDAKKACDNGTGTPDELLDLVQGSTGYEINEAMDRSGQGTVSWSRIGRPSRRSS